MNDKELQVVNFNQAKRLKKIGFDWNSSKGYQIMADESISRFPSDDNYVGTNFNGKTYMGSAFSAPTVPLALKWIRDEKWIPNAVGINSVNGDNFEGYYISPSIDTEYFKTYELAESALLDAILDHLENNNF